MTEQNAEYVRLAVADFDKSIAALQLELAREIWLDVHRRYQPVREAALAHIDCSGSGAP